MILSLNRFIFLLRTMQISFGLSEGIFLFIELPSRRLKPTGRDIQLINTHSRRHKPTGIKFFYNLNHGKEN
jgi:hypothetical protein